MSFLRAWEGTIYGVMRILVGLLFMQHGLQKSFGLFGGVPAEAPAFVVYIAGGIELVGGLLVAVGFQTVIAAFLCSGLMAAAYFMGHAMKGFFPIENQGELAILYCWIFLFIAAHGPGKFSLDGART
jgi:putative oxidoreductase